MAAMCKKCRWQSRDASPTRCPDCSSPQIIRHPELFDLGIAHIDCDAFYAAIEKRDRPELADKPVIVGGTGSRGVVSTACYIARTYGVHSAQPIFKAKKACPGAVILPPQMQKYTKEGRRIRELMRSLTPLVQPISIDEAFLDLSGTERLHGQPAVHTLLDFARQVEREIGITVSIGLSYCKFLAKIASDQNKPKGFTAIGKVEALSFLSEQPVSMIWGVGKALQKSLAKDGIYKIGQLQVMDEKVLITRYGSMGLRLSKLSKGEDYRSVDPVSPTKSISTEVTLSRDIADAMELENILWDLCEKLSRRIKEAGYAGSTLVLKLKTADFKTRTRNRKLDTPTQLADICFQHGKDLLVKETNGTAFRLIGIGLASLSDGSLADQPNLLGQDRAKQASAERAMDQLRAKFGSSAIKKGRGLS